MKFNIQSTTLKEALQILRGAVAKRTSLPALECVKLETGENQLALTTTNLEIALSNRVDAQVYERGEVLLPFARLSELVSALDGVIEFAIDEGHKATLRCGRSTYRVSGLDAEEFPLVTWPEPDYEMSILTFRELASVGFCASKEMSRPILTGIMVKCEGGYATAATADGYRMAVREVECDGEFSLLVRAEHMELFAKHALEDVAFETESNHATFVAGPLAMRAQVIDGNYPDYRQIFPQHTNDTVSIDDKAPLLAALRRITPVAAYSAHTVTLSFGADQVEITATSDVGDTGKEYVEVDFMGAPFEIRLNVLFLIEALEKEPTDNPSLLFVDGKSPVVVDGAMRQVLMPMTNKEKA